LYLARPRTAIVEYFIREEQVDQSYADLRSAETTRIHKSIHYLTQGCKTRKIYQGLFPLYVDERLFGNCRSLAGVNFSGIDLSGMSLSGVDMTYTNLRGANLTNANLDQAYFMGADLRGTTLQSANLNAADFRGANLAGANLANSTLENTDLEETTLLGTNFANANLLAVRGLEKERLQYALFCEAQIPENFDSLYQEICDQ
jgi:uncharacterized protein YjbI with pentapeptide repeats